MENKPDIFSGLRDTKLKLKLRETVTKKYAAIYRKLYCADTRKCGRISVCDIRKIVEEVISPLTDLQWLDIIEDFCIKDSELCYETFIYRYREAAIDDSKIWVKSMVKLPVHLPEEKKEFLASIKDYSRVRKEEIREECIKVDFLKLGSVRKHYFKRILCKVIACLSDRQFLWIYEAAPKNEFGYVKYEDYLYYFGSCNPCPGKEESTPPPAANLCQDPCVTTLAPCPAVAYEKIFTYKRPVDCKKILCGCGKSCPENYFAPEMCPEGRPVCAYDTCYRVERKQNY